MTAFAEVSRAAGGPAPADIRRPSSTPPRLGHRSGLTASRSGASPSSPSLGAGWRRLFQEKRQQVSRDARSAPPTGPPFGNLLVAGQSTLATPPNNGSCETSISRNNQSTSQVHPASDIAPMQSAFPPNALSIPAGTPSTIFMACSDIVRSFEQRRSAVKTPDTPTHP
jgi:hypothetical protein